MSQANSQTNNDMVSRCLKPSQALGLKVSKVVGTNSTGRRNWYLMGQRMSPKCVVACLGLGNFRTMRLQQGKKDRRFRIWGGVPRRIYYFDFKLTHLYLLFFVLLGPGQLSMSEEEALSRSLPIRALYQSSRNAATEAPWHKMC